MNKFLYKFHKVFAYVVIVPVILWVLSGLMHPFMANFFRTKPATYVPPFTQVVKKAADTLHLADIAKLNNFDSIITAREVMLGGNALLQVEHPDLSVKCYALNTGDEVKAADEAYAIFLAKHYAADSSATNDYPVEKITEHSVEYAYINRLLPVYMVVMDDMHYYVHTKSDRLGTVTDTPRRVFMHVFAWFHTWSFLPANTLIVGVICALLCLSSLAGVFIYLLAFRQFKKINASSNYLKKRKSHRRWGIAFSLLMLAFSFSGAYHALYKLGKTSVTYPLPQFSAKAVNVAFPAKAITLSDGDQALLYTASREGARLQKLSGEEIREANFYLAQKTLTLHNPSAKITKQELVTEFGGEYGFINKRLPVVKNTLESEVNETWYTEPRSGQVASVVVDADRAEGFSFAFLHKWHLFDFLGKAARDAITALFAILCLVIAIKGIILLNRG